MSWGQKGDKSDAYGFAEDLRTGRLNKHVFKAPWQFTRLRELSRSHSTLVSDTVRVQSRIKAESRHCIDHAASWENRNYKAPFLKMFVCLRTTSPHRRTISPEPGTAGRVLSRGVGA